MGEVLTFSDLVDKPWSQVPSDLPAGTIATNSNPTETDPGKMFSAKVNIPPCPHRALTPGRTTTPVYLTPPKIPEVVSRVSQQSCFLLCGNVYE